MPVLARDIACTGALLVLCACYSYNYNTQCITVRADEHPGLICSSNDPDGKTQRRERRARAIRRRKGRL